MAMLKKESSISNCMHCNRSVSSRRLSIHQMMCSTSHIRRGRSLLMQQKPLKKCMFCMESFQQQQFDFHMKLDCKHRLVPCIDCEDMFPLSLFTQHLQVCRAANHCTKGSAMQNQQNQGSSFLNTIFQGITSLGVTLYEKGSEAAEYCNKKIEQSGPTALLYFQAMRTRISETIQDLIQNLAHDENNQNNNGMSRDLISKMKIREFKDMRVDKLNQEQDLCTICYCQFYEPESVRQLNCKHFFHPSCIDKWLKINSTCPLCKKDQLQQQKDSLAQDQDDS